MGIFSRKDKTSSDRNPAPATVNSVLLFSGDDLRQLLTPATCLAALEAMYANLYKAPQDLGRSLSFEARGGVFHVKAGLSPGTHDYFAAKVNANYPKNPDLHGLPTIQGLIVLSECRTGAPVAVLQSGVLTGIRTAAATALAAKHGARDDSSTLAIIGCGEQSSYQAEAVLGVRRIKNLIIYDTDKSRAEAFKAWARGAFGVNVSIASQLKAAVEKCDICVTATTARAPIVTADMVPAGCFIAAVGADNPNKQEIHPAIFKNARILVDDVDQCVKSGDLAHAIRAGSASSQEVAATLAELAACAKCGRESASEIVIFDSTGVGVQDVAAGAAVYDAAIKSDSGQSFNFGDVRPLNASLKGGQTS